MRKDKFNQKMKTISIPKGGAELEKWRRCRRNNFKSEIILLMKEKRHKPVITLWLVASTDGWIYNDCWVGVVDRNGTVIVWVFFLN